MHSKTGSHWHVTETVGKNTMAWKEGGGCRAERDSEKS